MALQTFGLLLLQKFATTGSAPDTRCSLLDLCGVWSGQAQSQTTGRDARRATAIWRQLCGVTRTAASCQKDSIDLSNMFVSMKGGRATDSSTCELVVASALSLCLPHPLSPLSAPPCTRPGSGMAFDLAEKIHRKLRRAVRTPDDDFSFARGDLRDVCSPEGCYQVILHGQAAVKLSGSAWN